MDTIFDYSVSGKNRFQLPEAGCEDYDPIPEEYCTVATVLPEVSEVEVVRHYTNLSRMNFGVDNGMYPLGSCTMKYNPKINEKIAAMEGFSAIHPLADASAVQGCLRVLYELAAALREITGMTFSLCPAAGSHGELSGAMIIKKYFQDLKEARSVVLIPDSAHGTNPASVAMCGFTVKEIPSNSDGDVDVERLRQLLDGNVAAMMLTSPNTLGLFDRNIREISRLLRENGSLFYGDGANLNATAGRARMADMGFDIMHTNLHKTFSTPHGGGGPGSGPVGVVDRLAKYLPVPLVAKGAQGYYLEYDRPDSIGRVHSFYGNFLVALRAYAYIRSLGAEGIRDMSDTAVLNANYLLACLRDLYKLPIDRKCMHEFVISDGDMPNGVTTNDISKRILDYGFHSPTVYFPLHIEGAIMIEPTETETKKSMDTFVNAMAEIRREAYEEPEKVKTAPRNTPVHRVDAVIAARKPVLVWEG
ncbi:MAG: aminomethyl-transferring glycine dehydrogenase subunit GcvPB [Spirochaetes bacterium]|nr:aminomethyl-transferring glycine dehydrogenase subunit GcvPB [Spirochaetota bacterium]